ncbi:prepilin peptidase [Rhodoferax aquaticus]|uniref:Prepilin leader peptidase/N-methyltransferase n=1 Tax=Rhodoferax aquaticus TaxID=2527691 RepID=A0A515EW86_9BURK|nr:A24 family peptidase [Rhodoferax aquaticus]QDL56843.1 prepilin peptidase [Rhodoferax aquaticus]
MLESADIYLVLAAILGLLIGSFLNVVIYRLPKMLEIEWAADCEPNSDMGRGKADTFNLVVPRSSCPHCGHQITWYENIPLFSYLALRGRCSQCQAKISVRYPLIEVTAAALFYHCADTWGMTYSAMAWASFASILLALACIDWDTTLLPDVLTLPLLWLGLVAASLQWTQVSLFSSLWGAVAGYLSLWIVYWVFKIVTGKEGMGYGDFKLFAALGAWFGWQGLIPIILLSSVIGAIIGIGMKYSSGLREGGYIPFGPFLAGAGFAMLVLGPYQISRFLGI